MHIDGVNRTALDVRIQHFVNSLLPFDAVETSEGCGDEQYLVLTLTTTNLHAGIGEGCGQQR